MKLQFTDTWETKCSKHLLMAITEEKNKNNYKFENQEIKNKKKWRLTKTYNFNSSMRKQPNTISKTSKQNN